jgi:hypothetical protein
MIIHLYKGYEECYFNGFHAETRFQSSQIGFNNGDFSLQANIGILVNSPRLSKMRKI